MAIKAAYEQVEVRSRAGLRAWLRENCTSTSSIWLITYKKGSPHYLPYDDIVEEALCFGWIDSQPRKLDAERSMTLLSPRKPKSAWSGVNKARIERLVAQGLMTPAGQAKIDAAKASGHWETIDAAQALLVPQDLSDAFSRHAGSADKFAAFPPSARRSILEWISLAKGANTRASRVEKTAALAAHGVRANQWRKPPA